MDSDHYESVDSKIEEERQQLAERRRVRREKFREYQRNYQRERRRKKLQDAPRSIEYVLQRVCVGEAGMS